MSALSDLGPILPPRGDVRAKGQELARIAAVVVDITVAGPRCDVARAVKLLNRARAVLGPFDPDHLEQGAGAVPDMPERI